VSYFRVNCQKLINFNKGNTSKVISKFHLNQKTTELRILIVAESPREVTKLVDELTFVHQIEPHFKSYSLYNLHVDILITGLGSAFMTYHLTRALNMINYDLAINIGLAGSFDHFLEQGFVVNVIEEQFADLGVIHKNNLYTLTEEELMNEDTFPFTSGKLHSLGNFELDEIEALIPVKGITLNTLHSDPKWLAKIRDKFDPEVETMTGAAFFYVCLYEKIHFLQIRAISHFVEIRRIESWNIPNAIESLTGTTISILNELKID
jgi:futalosine hydrolase